MGIAKDQCENCGDRVVSVQRAGSGVAFIHATTGEPQCKGLYANPRDPSAVKPR